MINLLEYEDWGSQAQPKMVGQNVAVGDEVGYVLSYDSAHKVWIVRFPSGVRPVSAKEMKEVEEAPGGPFGKPVKQTASTTLAI